MTPGYQAAACLAWFASLILFPSDCQSANAEHDAGLTIYDPDPAHLWNRLHRAIYARSNEQGRLLGTDRVDPLLWSNTRHLLSGPSNLAALRVLEEFEHQHGERLFADPLRRALLQRDLWAVFDWAASHSASSAEQKAGRERLLIRLAAAIRQVALTQDQIKNLPDNLAAAVESKHYPAEFDPAHPDDDFLPPQMLMDGGPWVLLKSSDNRAITPAHDASFDRRSAFLVLLRLPGGRKQALDYLKQLRKTENPWPSESSTTTRPANQRTLRADLPQLPAGAELALVRRALLIDDRGAIVPSPLVETVQLRRFLQSPASNAARGELNQLATREFQLSRAKLLAGEAGGLVAPRRDFLFVQFAGHGVDSIERNTPPNQPGGLEADVRGSCFICHAAPGIHSMLSLQNSFAEPGLGRIKLVEEKLAALSDLAAYNKGKERTWGLLEGLRIAADTPVKAP